MKIRSFLAFEISDDMKAELNSIISFLSSKTKDVRWLSPELMHCTIRFFGDFEESLLLGDVADIIEGELVHQSPIHLDGRGIGVFPNWRYPKILWAGLVGETDVVSGLHAKLEDAFEPFNFEKDKRALRLHLTIGRLKGKTKNAQSIMQLVSKLVETEFGSIVVDNLVLFKSILTKEGPEYTSLRRFKLGGVDSADVAIKKTSNEGRK